MLKFLSGTAIALAIAAPAWAQTGTGATQIDRTNYPFLGEQSENVVWSANSLVGNEVQTADGETIGEVEDVIFTQDDRIAGIVVDAGDYLGTDDRNVALDWYAVSVDPSQEVLVVNLTKDQLQGSPTYQSAGSWRMQKEAEDELPDVAESQPGVIAGEGVDEETSAAPGGEGGGQSHGGDGGGASQ